MTRLFDFRSSLSRDLDLLCCDKTSIPCIGIFIATWKSLSRPCLSVLSLFLCRDLKIPVATSKSLFSLEVCRNIELFYCNQFSSLSQHHLLQLCFSIRTRNLVFHCRDKTSSYSVSKGFPSCNNQCRNRRRLCCDIDSAFYFSLCRNIN